MHRDKFVVILLLLILFVTQLTSIQQEELDRYKEERRNTETLIKNMQARIDFQNRTLERIYEIFGGEEEFEDLLWRLEN